MAKQLEGKYLLFDYSASFTNGLDAYAVLKIEEGKVIEYWDPYMRSDGCMGDRDGPNLDNLNDNCIDQLVEDGICEIFTFAGFAPHELLGFTLRDDKSKDCFVYRSVDKQRFDSVYSTKGIELKLLDFQYSTL